MVVDPRKCRCFLPCPQSWWVSWRGLLFRYLSAWPNSWGETHSVSCCGIDLYRFQKKWWKNTYEWYDSVSDENPFFLLGFRISENFVLLKYTQKKTTRDVLIHQSDKKNWSQFLELTSHSHPKMGWLDIFDRWNGKPWLPWFRNPGICSEHSKKDGVRIIPKTTKKRKLTNDKTRIQHEWSLKMYFLLKMEIFQLVMLVFRGVTVSLLPECKPWLAKRRKNLSFSGGFPVYPRFFQGRTAKLLGFQRRLKLQDFLPSRVSSLISKNLEQKGSNHFWGLWGFNVHLTPGLPYPHSPRKQGFSFGLTEGNPIAMSLLRPFFAAERQNDSKSKDDEPSD